MVSRSDRILTQPGLAKRARMLVALHETTHGVAFNRLCGVWAHAVVFSHGGGLCSHGRIADAKLREESIAIAAGPAAEFWAPLAPIPAGRCRAIRRPPCHAQRRRDEQWIAMYSRSSEEFLPGRGFDPIEISNAADHFVFENLGEIFARARELFHRGSLYLPAPGRER